MRQIRWKLAAQFRVVQLRSHTCWNGPLKVSYWYSTCSVALAQSASTEWGCDGMITILILRRISDLRYKRCRNCSISYAGANDTVDLIRDDFRGRKSDWHKRYTLQKLAKNWSYNNFPWIMWGQEKIRKNKTRKIFIFSCWQCLYRFWVSSRKRV